VTTPLSNEVLKTLCQFLAEQAYMNHLVAKRLVKLGFFEAGELQRLSEADPNEKKEFCLDFLNYLKSIGLENH
jgi:hypothetical protein